VIVWTLEPALHLVRALNERLTPAGFCCGLTGGVLFRGQSGKDVDLIVYPRCVSPTVWTAAAFQSVHAALGGVGLTLRRTSEEVRRGWREKGSGDTKTVEEWVDGLERRVDVFYLS